MDDRATTMNGLPSLVHACRAVGHTIYGAFSWCHDLRLRALPAFATQLSLLVTNSALTPSNHLFKCEDYSWYSQRAHGPLSEGHLKLPHMRPSPECRTFVSPAGEVRDASAGPVRLLSHVITLGDGCRT